MIVFKRGLVSLNKDDTNSGKMFALILGLHYIIVEGEPVSIEGPKNALEGYHGVPVTYTSPYFDKFSGGIMAIPNPGTEVFLLYDEEAKKYFYLSTIVGEPVYTGSSNPKMQNKNLPQKYSHTKYGIPKALTFKDYKGAGLLVSNYNEKNEEEEVIGPRVELISSNGHKLLLSDSPELDQAILKNSQEDGITITAHPTEIHSANSIEIKSRGPQSNVVFDAHYLVLITDGTDIDLVNLSTGSKAPGVGNVRQTGNINITSSERDITVWTAGSDGNIFINASGGGNLESSSVIQINCNGRISIWGNDIDIKSKGNLKLNADGNINIEGENVNILARRDMNAKALQNLRAEGSIATSLGAGSSRLDLNHPNGSGANPGPATVSDLKKNAYGRG